MAWQVCLSSLRLRRVWPDLRTIHSHPFIHIRSICLLYPCDTSPFSKTHEGFIKALMIHIWVLIFSFETEFSH